jgi:hypothetical protein
MKPKPAYSLERDVMRLALAIGADDQDVKAAYELADALAAAAQAEPGVAEDLPRIHRRMEMAGFIARMVEARP